MTKWLEFLEAMISNFSVSRLDITSGVLGLDRKIPTFGNSGFVFSLWGRYDLNGRKSRNYKTNTHRCVIVYDKISAKSQC